MLYSKYGQNALYDGGLQVRSTLDTRLQNYAVSALRTGLVRYDRRHGWRGAVSNINIAGNWKDALASAGNQSGIDTWRVAVVLGFGDGTVHRNRARRRPARHKFRSTNTAWARKELPGAGVGAEPTSPEEVVKVGDVIYVEPVDSQGDYGLRQVPEVNGAIVAMDPHTGRVLALSGGFSYASSQFDRAMQAMRQPGSAFKPFVYAAALDNGFTPVTKVDDAPISLAAGSGLADVVAEEFRAESSWDRRRCAVASTLSLNAMTVRLASQIGMDKIVPYPVRFGVYDRLPAYLSNALGAYETTLIRLTTGYAEFVNGGKKINATLIDRIQDRNGLTIYRHDPRNCDGCNPAVWADQSEPLLADTANRSSIRARPIQIVSLLEGVVQRGTGVAVKAVGKPLAGKTGTSNEAKDIWFIGFSPDLTCGVFVGFDNPRTLGRREQGATVAAPIFRDFMIGALADQPPTPFRVPPGIEFVSIDARSGALANPGDPDAILEAFKAGTQPGVAITDTVDQTGTTNSNTGNNVGQGTGGLY